MPAGLSPTCDSTYEKTMFLELFIPALFGFGGKSTNQCRREHQSSLSLFSTHTRTIGCFYARTHTRTASIRT